MSNGWKHKAGYGNRKPAAPKPPDPDADQLTGTVENVVYHSEETTYTVCRVKIPKQRDAATLVGTCAAIWEGELVRATGEWIRHPQHGYQFQAQTIVCVPPSSAMGIERYLASGMIRGIGKVMAKRIVERFGEETLKIIEKESQRLEEVSGIGRHRRQMIKESWNEQKGVREIMIFLQGHGIGVGQSARIYRRYGDQSVAVIRENPYRLCADVWGIGFKTADGVAKSLGIAPDSPLRARAGIIYLLRTMSDEGHCYCTQAELLLQAEALLDIPVEVLAEALQHEIEGGYLIQEDDGIYLAPLHEAENRVAARLQALQHTNSGFKPIDVDKALPWAAERMKIEFAPRQAEALGQALTEKVAIITGGPGVGKTTIIRALVEIFGARRLRVLLAAPTGRAAKRMEEATHHEAATIHRLLKFQPRTGEFEHNRDNPLDGDIFILDEVSMIDIRLMADFLEALPDHGCLALVGDTDQLPSVGPGNVLRDLIHSRTVASCKLDVIFRQKTGGWIIRNAHHVNRGEELETPSGPDADFYFIQTDEPDQVIERVVDLVTRRIPKRFGFDPLSEIQVLTPMRRNQLGAENLNAVLQEALNPNGPSLSRYGRNFRQGDRIMQIRNNYDKNVFNGDVGRIEQVNLEEQQVTVNYDGVRVLYESNELEELLHAYACSIHKSQGSEYPAVVILLATQHFKLLQRNLLYTAITRGKKLVCLVGSNKAVYIAIRNNEIRQRRTGLRDRLVRAQQEVKL